MTEDAPEWDGVGLLSFASAPDYTERLFDGEAGQRAIFEDIPRFLDLDRGETLPATEYVFRDDAWPGIPPRPDSTRQFCAQRSPSGSSAMTPPWPRLFRC